MPFRFACQQCRQLFRVSPRRIGLRLNCPKCGASLVVPTEHEAQRQLAAALQEHRPGQGSAEVEFDQLDATEPVYESHPQPPECLPPPDRVDANTIAVPRSVIYVQGALLGIVAVVAFVLGTFFSSIFPESAPPAVSFGPHMVLGQVVLIANEGRREPDAGSAVLAVPAERLPDDKFPVIGLRTQDTPLAPDAPTLQGVHLLGGDYTRAETEGGYRLRLPRTGDYFVLVISASSRRTRGQIPSRKDLAELGRYVTSAIDLLGDQHYRWTRHQIKSDVTLDWEFASPTD